jgi:hypothetical protein
MFMVCSCQNIDNELLISNELPKLTIDHLKHLVAQPYFESVKVVYKNADNIEKVFHISFKEEVEQRSFENKIYESEKIGIGLTNDETPKIALYITVGGNYTSLTNHSNYAICGISPFGDGNYRPSITLNSDGGFFILTVIENELELLGKKFLNVFTNHKNEAADSYSELFYTVEKGIIGFRDQNNELWVLDRYEE